MRKINLFNKIFMAGFFCFVFGVSLVQAQDFYSQNNGQMQNNTNSQANSFNRTNFTGQSYSNSFTQPQQQYQSAEQYQPTAKSQSASKYQPVVKNQSMDQSQSTSPYQQESQMQQQSSLIQKSLVEQIFSYDSDLGLKQVGYDIFSTAASQGFGKYDGNYKLNIGEKVNVYFWGDSVDMLSMAGSSMLSPIVNTQVDTKGNVFVPGVGVVKAEGRSVSDVEREIQSMASQKFANAKTRITVADGTEFPVFIYGYVNKPGRVTIGTNSSVIEALAAAGGVKRNGTLRNITYKSASGGSQKVDLYGIIFNGKDNGLRLQPNDVIYVNRLGSVVALKNGVETPGIYEVNPSESVSQLINYAGGLLPSTDKSLVNVKAYKNGQRVSTDVNYDALKKTKLANGDILEFHNLYGVAENVVSLEGNVKHPGIFEYKKGMKLSDVLKNRNELLDETFVHQAVINRVASVDGKHITSIPVSLDEFFNGGNNPLLQPKDKITVFNSTNGEFIQVYGCINKPKRVPFNENLTLKDLMTDLQFIKSADSEENVHNVSMISNNKVLIPAYDIAVEITNDNTNTEQTLYLYDVLIQNDGIDLTINPGDKIFFRPLREDEIVKKIKVSGFVNRPGVYSFVDGKKLSDMLQIAGGLAKEADLRGIVYRRMNLTQKGNEMVTMKNANDAKLLSGMMANDQHAKEDTTKQRGALLDEIQNDKSKVFTSKAVGRISLNIKTNDIRKIDNADNIEVQDGDEIYVPKFSNHIMVMGEVYNEASFLYKKDSKASYYINLVGGYTPNARKTKVYRVDVTGKAHRVHVLVANKVEPGDTIIVPMKIAGNDWITPLAGTLQSIASLLTSVFVVMNINK